MGFGLEPLSQVTGFYKEQQIFSRHAIDERALSSNSSAGLERKIWGRSQSNPALANCTLDQQLTNFESCVCRGIGVSEMG